MNGKYILAIITLVVGGTGGFFGGIKYDQSKAAAARNQAFGQFRGTGIGGAGAAGGAARRAGGVDGFGGGAARGGAGFVTGDILNKDATSITVAGQDGGSKIIFYSASTTIGKTTNGDVADLETGKFVMVNGTSNSAGTISAQSIQIRPMSIATTLNKTYSMTDVQAANSASNCLTVVSGTVYDLTAWISKHPGGDKAILSICGMDGTSAFQNQHGGQMRPEQVLSGFEVGVLK